MLTGGDEKTFYHDFDETAPLFEQIYVNAGTRGMQMKLLPDDLIKIVDAVSADLI
jgi:prolyl-tRNA editing enzyme YbaK/EbsC (Cys-tRNA(Pro) deacylase)